MIIKWIKVSFHSTQTVQVYVHVGSGVRLHQPYHTRIKGREVKYWPVPFFHSLAAFSSKEVELARKNGTRSPKDHRKNKKADFNLLLMGRIIPQSMYLVVLAVINLMFMHFGQG